MQKGDSNHEFFLTRLDRINHMPLFQRILNGPKSNGKKPRLKKSKSQPKNKTSLQRLTKYDLNIQDIVIQFAINRDLKKNDPYMIADWLPDKIFVEINPNHPFWIKIKSNNEKKSTYINMLAVDAFVQWQILKLTSQVTPSKLISLKDIVKREISLESKYL